MLVSPLDDRHEGEAVEMPRLVARAMLRMGIWVGEITVVGRKSGQERTAIVQKAAAPGGSYYVAGQASHQWALNVRAAGRCRFAVRGHLADYDAVELEGEERAAAVRALAPPFSGAGFTIDGLVFRLDRTS
jgi:deazaflavin-dependent oxidoreductase (nitroreductase family)